MTHRMTRTDGQLQRPGIDHDPIKPWQWATTIPHGVIEIVSYPIPGDGSTDIDDDNWTIMVRTTVGEPGTLEEVPLKSIACFAPDRHEWNDRPRRYYDPDNPTAFVFDDT